MHDPPLFSHVRGLHDRNVIETITKRADSLDKWTTRLSFFLISSMTSSLVQTIDIMILLKKTLFSHFLLLLIEYYEKMVKKYFEKAKLRFALSVLSPFGNLQECKRHLSVYVYTYVHTSTHTHNIQ